MSTKQVTISEAQKVAAEEQISKLRKEIDYNTRDYTIDFLIQQFRSDEFYIPDEYQRQYIWNEADKNRFVESILLGLPIPLMFFSDTEDGRCEIIDGAQRTQAMEEFMSMRGSAHSGCPGGCIKTAISIEREPTSPIPPSSKC